MKKLKMLTLGLAVSLALVSCNNSNPTTAPTTEPTTVTTSQGETTGANAATTTPTPQYTFDYSIEHAVNTEVTFGADPFLISGTLSIPEDAVGKVPAVIIVGGSGPTDRDGTVGKYKPYKEYAQELVKNGVAVLRYDKRTFTHSQQMLIFPDILEEFSLSDEYVLDAIAGLELLAKHDQIDPKKIFLLGHSQGANVAPMIASQYNGDLAGVIMLAPNHSPIHHLLYHQIEFIANLDGTVDETEALHIQEAKELRDYVDSPDFGVNFDPSKALGIFPKYWNEIKSYDPILAITSLTDRSKFLILHGNKDYQVPPTEANIFEIYLSAEKNVSIFAVSNANHIFHNIEGQMGPQNYTEDNELSIEMIRLVSNFIKK